MLDEADVLVFDKGFHFQGVVLGHDQHDRLGGGDHAANGVDGQFLYRACHRCGQLHESAVGFGLLEFLFLGGGFLLAFGDAVQAHPSGFGGHRSALPFGFVDGGLNFIQAAALVGEVGLLFDVDLFAFQIVMASDIAQIDHLL